VGQAAVAGIDPYLIHSFETDTYEGVGERSADRRPVLPMLVRVTDPAAVRLLENVEDCSVTSSMGNIVACFGSIRTIRALENEPRIVSVEASRPSSGHDCTVSVPFVRANRIQNDPQQPEKGDGALVAVIDGGIDVLHETFRDSDDRTRIISIWIRLTRPDQHRRFRVENSMAHSTARQTSMVISQQEVCPRDSVATPNITEPT
jgi:hypothetical protein